VLVEPGSNGGFLAKISDFGLSRSVENSYYKTEDGRIPIKWSAPEVLKYGTNTSKSDVYSFGILLWELFSFGELPYAEFSNERARVEILNGRTLSSPEDCLPGMFDIMQKCWEKESENRPSFIEICRNSEKLYRQFKMGDKNDEMKTSTSDSWNGDKSTNNKLSDSEFYGYFKDVSKNPKATKATNYGQN